MTKTYLVSETILRQVLDALDDCMDQHDKADWSAVDARINELRTLLAKEPSEPVAWMTHTGVVFVGGLKYGGEVPLYRKDL